MPMRIIPVIDILNGKVVKAIGGKREEYKPLESVLTKSTEPLDFALAFESLGFKELYLADLDAILGRGPNLSLYEMIISNTDLILMIDAGINDLEKAKSIDRLSATRVIIGTETLESIDFIRKALNSLGSDKVIVSMDLKNGRVISRCNLIRSYNKYTVARLLHNFGVQTIIVLDLEKVGTETGVNISEVKKLLDIFDLNLLVGGGIRDIKNLRELRKIGVFGALIASILHNGRITKEDLKSGGFI